MREILFRGKRVDNGEWVYGDLSQIHYKVYISQFVIDNTYQDGADNKHLYKHIWVLPETVGQYTGLTDKHGKKIFDGDIVKTKYGRLCIVVWFSSPAHNGWDLHPVNTVENCIRTKCPDAYDLYTEENLEVIGNVIDNPELLEVE